MMLIKASWSYTCIRNLVAPLSWLKLLFLTKNYFPTLTTFRYEKLIVYGTNLDHSASSQSLNKLVPSFNKIFNFSKETFIRRPSTIKQIQKQVKRIIQDHQLWFWSKGRIGGKFKWPLLLWKTRDLVSRLGPSSNFVSFWAIKFQNCQQASARWLRTENLSNLATPKLSFPVIISRRILVSWA